MFILTDGKNYVMENPLKPGDYLRTTSPVHAKEFTYKQARGLTQRSGKRYSWIKNFQLINADNGHPNYQSMNYKGNAGIYIGENDIEFDENILLQITEESKSLIGLAGWDMNQLEIYQKILNTALSKCDSAESDVKHALQKYKEDNQGKKPQAHKMAKICYLLDDIRDKHKRLKQCIRYIQVMKDAITYKYDIGKLKLELISANDGEYKGRTEYYSLALDLLN